MTGQTLAEVLAEVYAEHRLDHALLGTVDSPGGFAASFATRATPAVTAHLAAILADPETVEAVMDAICDSQGGDYVSTDDARAAIAVIAGRLGVAL